MYSTVEYSTVLCFSGDHFFKQCSGDNVVLLSVERKERGKREICFPADYANYATPVTDWDGAIIKDVRAIESLYKKISYKMIFIHNEYYEKNGAKHGH